MAQTQQIDLNKLLGEFRKYKDPMRIRTDVMNVSRHVRTLVPQAGNLILNNGEDCRLLVLVGTVAIFFRGAQYNIPIEIFITEAYPESPPMVYVRPTHDMAIKNGHRHVDSAGLVYLPYLHEWNGRTHNIVELCACMSSVFGTDPPVYAKPRSPPSGTATQPVWPQSPKQAAKPPEDPKELLQRELTSQMQEDLQKLYSDLRQQIDGEFGVQGQLQQSQQQVAGELQQLKDLKQTLVTLILDLTEKNELLRKHIVTESAKGPVDVNDLVEPADALSRQMMDLVAENAAIDDLLYYLDQAITDGRISLDEFLRETRKLARRQFMCRALMAKVSSIKVQASPERQPPAHSYPLPSQQAAGYFYRPGSPAPWSSGHVQQGQAGYAGR